MTAGLPRAGSLAGLLLLPLAVPLLIFGAAATAPSLLRGCGVAAADRRRAVRRRRRDPGGHDLARPAREYRGRQKQAARFLAHRHFAHLDRPAEVARAVCLTSSPIASADMRTA